MTRKAPSGYSVYITVLPCQAFAYDGEKWFIERVTEPLEIEFSRWGFIGGPDVKQIPEGDRPFFMTQSGKERWFVPWQSLVYAVYECPCNDPWDALSNLYVDLQEGMEYHAQSGWLDFPTDFINL